MSNVSYIRAGICCIPFLGHFVAGLTLQIIDINIKHLYDKAIRKELPFRDISDEVLSLNRQGRVYTLCLSAATLSLLVGYFMLEPTLLPRFIGLTLLTLHCYRVYRYSCNIQALEQFQQKPSRTCIPELHCI